MYRIINIVALCGGVLSGMGCAGARQCGDLHMGMDEVWNESIKADVRVAFANVESEDPQYAAEMMISKMNDFYRSLEKNKESLCNEFKDRKLISEEIYAMRLACYNSALMHQQSYVTYLTDADEDTLDTINDSYVRNTHGLKACLKESIYTVFDSDAEVTDKEALKQAEAVLIEGRVEISREHYDVGMAKFQMALSLFEEISHTRGEAITSDAIGSAMMDIAEYAGAIEYFERTLIIQKNKYGEKHPKIASILHDIGFAMRELGKYKESIEYSEQALSIWRNVYGDKHLKTAVAINSIGAGWEKIGEYEKAIEYYEQALAIWKREYGEDSKSVALPLNNIGACLKELGKYDEALEHYEPALAIWMRVYGENHTRTGTGINNIGGALEGLGKHEEALEYYERALAIWQKVYEDNHSQIGIGFNNVGACLNKLGKTEEAIEYYDKALAIWKEAYGGSHPLVAICLYNIGSVMYDLERYEKALGYYEESLKVDSQFFEEDHPNLKAARKWIKKCKEKLGRQD